MISLNKYVSSTWQKSVPEGGFDSQKFCEHRKTLTPICFYFVFTLLFTQYKAQDTFKVEGYCRFINRCKITFES